MNEHLMCFKSAWDCWTFRAPLLVYGTLLTSYSVIVNFIGVVIFGNVQAGRESFDTISDSQVLVTTSIADLPAPLQWIFYDVVPVGVLLVAFLFVLLIRTIYNEIKKIPQTIKECQCKDE